MSDHKSWLWRKKSSEKAVVVADKEDLTSKAHEEEINGLLAEKEELEIEVRGLSDKLSSANSECKAKDDLAKKHATTAQEALAGWEKAEAKALSLKQELDEALEQKKTSDENASHLDAALKECMQQLRFVREDQEHRIHDVLVKASEELEDTKLFFQEKLAASAQKLAKLTAENSQLNKMLLLKEQLIEKLNQQRGKAESEVDALLAKQESMEKENNSLRYEVRLQEREVEIRNEEREFNRRASDAAHRQHLENVKKIAKLESECQRLRVLVRKRLPGPGALAKMKNEVHILNRETTGSRRRNSNSNLDIQQLDYTIDSHPESPGRKINFLTERIGMMEEENSSLRESLQKKMNELQNLKSMFVQTASRLSQVETQLEESPKAETINDGRRSSIASHDVIMASMSDVGSDDKASYAGSWASALVSELEHFRDGKDKVALSPSRSVAASDINHFMDDFAEMEKLALVCVEKPIENPPVMKNESTLDSLSEISGKELVPVPLTDDANVSGNKQMPSKLSLSISKLIGIIEGINLPSKDYDVSQGPSAENVANFPQKTSEMPTGYVVHVFQWKTSELSSILQNVISASDAFLNGKVDFGTFTQELTCALEWIINHCFSLQDVTCMKEEIKKRAGWDETRSESEIEAGISGISQQLQPAANECDSFRNQLQISESTIASLQVELEALTHSKAMVEDQFENLQMTIQDLNSQLSLVRSELEEAHQKIAAPEKESEVKVVSCCEEVAESQNLQVQPNRASETDTSKHVNQDNKQLQNEQDFAAASEKLAECQETILHLGKQLQALASSRETVVSDKFVSTPTATSITNATATEKTLMSQRSSLFDQMQAEDNTETDQLESPETKEIICPEAFGPGTTKDHIVGFGSKRYRDDMGLGALAIVPIKKKQASSGLLKKLLWRKKRNTSKKMTLTFAV